MSALERVVVVLFAAALIAVVCWPFAGDWLR